MEAVTGIMTPLGHLRVPVFEQQIVSGMATDWVLEVELKGSYSATASCTLAPEKIMDLKSHTVLV